MGRVGGKEKRLAGRLAIIYDELAAQVDRRNYSDGSDRGEGGMVSPRNGSVDGVKVRKSAGKICIPPNFFTRGGVGALVFPFRNNTDLTR